MESLNLTSLIGVGAEAEVYKAGSCAVKLFKEHCPKEEAFYEAAIHTSIESTGLPMPRIHQVININDRWAIVMDLVEGITMRDIIYNDLGNIEEHMSEIIDLQIKMHQAEIAGLLKLNHKLERRILSTSLLKSEEK